MSSSSSSAARGDNTLSSDVINARDSNRETPCHGIPRGGTQSVYRRIVSSCTQWPASRDFGRPVVKLREIGRTRRNRLVASCPPLRFSDASSDGRKRSPSLAARRCSLVLVVIIIIIIWLTGGDLWKMGFFFFRKSPNRGRADGRADGRTTARTLRELCSSTGPPCVWMRRTISRRDLYNNIITMYAARNSITIFFFFLFFFFSLTISIFPIHRVVAHVFFRREFTRVVSPVDTVVVDSLAQLIYIIYTST